MDILQALEVIQEQKSNIIAGYTGIFWFVILLYIIIFIILNIYMRETLFLNIIIELAGFILLIVLFNTCVENNANEYCWKNYPEEMEIYVDVKDIL